MACAAMTGCYQDNDAPTLTRAEFTATIAEQYLSRAANAAWDAQDEIGISGVTGLREYANVEYVTTAGDGVFAAVREAETILFTTDDPVTFTAYYPYSTEGTQPLTASTADQNQQRQFDFLYGTGTGSNAAPDVALAFTHRMAKVVFTLKTGEDVTYDELKAATMEVDGLVLSGTFDPQSGEAAADATQSAATLTLDETTQRTLDDEAETVSYEVILFPQQPAEALELTFHSGGAGYRTLLTLPDEHSLLVGTQYDVRVTLNKTEAVVNGCTIADWTLKDPIDLSAQ